MFLIVEIILITFFLFPDWNHQNQQRRLVSSPALVRNSVTREGRITKCFKTIALLDRHLSSSGRSVAGAVAWMVSSDYSPAHFEIKCSGWIEWILNWNELDVKVEKDESAPNSHRIDTVSHASDDIWTSYISGTSYISAELDKKASLI